MNDQILSELANDPHAAQVLPFQLEGRPARGRAVRLHGVVDEILARHDYPDDVARMLAHALTLVCILGNTLKFKGKLILQVKGNGPVSSLVADYKTPEEGEDGLGEIRGWAKVDLERFNVVAAEGLDPTREAPQLLGAGHLAFTIDQGPDTDRYQGIVGLEGATLAECAQSYFDQSEQLPTIIKLSADRGADGWRAGGIMLQHLAATGGHEAGRASAEAAEESWREGAVLMASARDDELLSDDLALPGLLYRLFHEIGVRVFDPVPVGVLCQCTRERIGTVLAQFSDDELRDMVVDGVIGVNCEFCNKTFDFTPPAE